MGGRRFLSIAVGLSLITVAALPGGAAVSDRDCDQILIDAFEGFDITLFGSLQEIAEEVVSRVEDIPGSSIDGCGWTKEDALGHWPLLAAGVDHDTSEEAWTPPVLAEEDLGVASTQEEIYQRVVAPCGGAPAQGTVTVSMHVLGERLPSAQDQASPATSGIYTENGPVVNGQGPLFGVRSDWTSTDARAIAIVLKLLTRKLSVTCGEAIVEGKVGPVTVEAGAKIPCDGYSMGRLLVSGYIDLFGEADLYVPLPCEQTHQLAGGLGDVDPDDPCLGVLPICSPPPIPDPCNNYLEPCDKLPVHEVPMPIDVCSKWPDLPTCSWQPAGAPDLGILPGP